MPRTKKVKEVKEEVKEEIIEKKDPVRYGTGWSGINNRIQAELRGEVEKNE